MNPGAILIQNQLIMDMQRRGGGYNGKPPKGSWIIPVVIFILCLLFMWWADNGFSDDFGKNNCGDPCYAGGCPECPKTKEELQKECDDALKEFDDYRKSISSAFDSGSRYKAILLEFARIKCERAQ